METALRRRAPRNDQELSAQTWSALRAYLQAHQQELKVDLNELTSTPRVAIYDKGNLIFVYVPRVVGGIPVRDNSIGAAINHGNLILLGLQKWGDVDVAPTRVHLGGVGARRGAQRTCGSRHVRRVHEGPAPRVHPDGRRRRASTTGWPGS